MGAGNSLIHNYTYIQLSHVALFHDLACFVIVV